MYRQLLDKGLINNYLELLRKAYSTNSDKHHDIFTSVESHLSTLASRDSSVVDTLIKEVKHGGSAEFVSRMTEIIKQVNPKFDYDFSSLSEQLANISLKEEPKMKGKSKSSGKKANSQTIRKSYNLRSSKNVQTK